jgi:hypothetical protein
VVRLAASVLVVLLVAGITVAATPCPPGTFDPLVSPVDGLPLAGGSSPSGAFVVDAGTITMGACGSTELRVRARRRNTFLHAVWESCPGFGRVRYQGTTNYPPCKALVSVLRWRDQTTGRRHALKFESLRFEHDSSRTIHSL